MFSRTLASLALIALSAVPASAQTLVNGISVVSPTQATQLFNVVAARRDIAFRYALDGCYARAHLMIEHMQRLGFRPGKAWAFADSDLVKGAMLYVTTRNSPKGYVTWRYHVAPLLKVRMQNGAIYDYVIDPSLNTGPVLLANWQRQMINPKTRYVPRIEVTRFGYAAHDSRGRLYAGSGYWPGADPAGGLTAAATKTMAAYKPLEGTDKVPGAKTTALKAMVVDNTPYAHHEVTDRTLLP